MSTHEDIKWYHQNPEELERDAAVGRYREALKSGEIENPWPTPNEAFVIAFDAGYRKAQEVADRRLREIAEVFEEVVDAWEAEDGPPPKHSHLADEIARARKLLREVH